MYHHIVQPKYIPFLFANRTSVKLEGKSHYLMYEETEPAVKTIIKAKENEVVISRSGEMKSTLKVSKDKNCDTVYQTPYGPLYMTVCGIEVENNLREGSLLLEYKLENNTTIAHNRIEITLKEV